VKVALVSTYPPARCGIGEYTHNLRDALSEIDPATTYVVIAEKMPVAMAQQQPGVIRAWHRDEAWPAHIASAIRELRPDVVHLQHEEAILNQDGRLVRLLTELRNMDVATLVTLHSVYPGIFAVPGRMRPGPFHRALAAAGAQIIVHQQGGCADVLRAQGVPREAIAVIPHGTISIEKPDRTLARAKLKLPDAPTVLFFGVLHRKKGIHTLVKAFPNVRKEIPSGRLLIAGQPRQRNIIDTLYRRWLEPKIARGVSEGWLTHHLGFIADDCVADYLAAADVVAFPHNQTYGSASGVLHLALAAGCAHVCTRGPKFFEAYEAFGDRIPEAFAQPGDAASWTKALVAFLGDTSLRHRAEQAAKAYGQITRWSEVARQHAQLYATRASLRLKTRL